VVPKACSADPKGSATSSQGIRGYISVLMSCESWSSHRVLLKTQVFRRVTLCPGLLVAEGEGAQSHRCVGSYSSTGVASYLRRLESSRLFFTHVSYFNLGLYLHSSICLHGVHRDSFTFKNLLSLIYDKDHTVAQIGNGNFLTQKARVKS
jgi:hypothetical protein